jgi:hypothetical protein
MDKEEEVVQLNKAISEFALRGFVQGSNWDGWLRLDALMREVLARGGHARK